MKCILVKGVQFIGYIMGRNLSTHTHTSQHNLITHLRHRLLLNTMACVTKKNRIVFKSMTLNRLWDRPLISNLFGKSIFNANHSFWVSSQLGKVNLYFFFARHAQQQQQQTYCTHPLICSFWLGKGTNTLHCRFNAFNVSQLCCPLPWLTTIHSRFWFVFSPFFLYFTIFSVSSDCLFCWCYKFCSHPQLINLRFVYVLR